MAILATYVAANQFRVSGDLASKFDPGRAILAYHTNYGSKLVYTDYASYDSTNGYTNIYTVQDESENLLSDLGSVDISSVKPDTGGLGNVPVELLWMFRGLRKGAYVYYNSDTTFKINKGYIHFNDGLKDKILYIPGTLTITPTISSDLWYYIYINVPTNGIVVTSSDISITTTAPVLDYVKQGYYSVGKRCIGFFRTDTVGPIITYFYMDDLIYTWVYGYGAWITGTSSYVSQPASGTMSVPLANARYLFNVHYGDSAAARQGYIRETGDPDDTTYQLTTITTSSQKTTTAIMVFIDADKQLSIKSAGANLGFLFGTTCLFLPIGLSGQM